MVKCNKLNQTPQYSAELIENNTKDFCKMPAENGKPFQRYKLHANFPLCKNYTGHNLHVNLQNYGRAVVSGRKTLLADIWTIQLIFEQLD